MKRRGADKRNDTGLIDRRDERRGAAVHDRHFRAVDLDDRVVDAKPGQRGQHMLRGGAQRAFGIADHGGEFGGGHGADIGANFAVRAAVLAETDEDDAGVGFGGKHVQRGRRAGMDANTADGGRGAKRGLPASFHSWHLPPARGPRVLPLWETLVPRFCWKAPEG